MKNRKWMRPWLVVLAVVMLLTSVLVAGGVAVIGDINNDGVITVFDAQLLLEGAAGLRELPASQGSIPVSNIVDYVLGKGATVDIADMNGDGILEIYTVEGLNYMAANPSLDYVLETDLDLEGVSWKPIANFSGTFYGKGHTISNVKIVGGTAKNVGFFGDTTAEAIVNSLNLRNATITASGNQQFIGLAVGINRGALKNLTVTGTIIDTRTATTSGGKIYEGGLVGSLTSGYITGGTSVTVTDEYGRSSVSGLAAELSVIVQDSNNVISNGLCGRVVGSATVTDFLWRDYSNCAAAYSEALQERQQTVADYMNTMGSVAWTTQQETIFFNKNLTNLHTQVFKPGTIRYGLPYNGRNGGLERFLYCMVNGTSNDAGSASNPYVMDNATFGTYSDKSASPMTGFAIYMGNDCSDAVGWAWMQVSPNRTQGTNDSEYAGGHYLEVTRWMMPTTEEVYMDYIDASGNYVYEEDGTKKQARYYINVQENNGFYPVGNWTTVAGANGTNLNDSIADTSKFAYQIPSAEFIGIPQKYTDVINVSQRFLDYNGTEVMAEAYALTRKGDGVVMFNGKGGHARLVTGFPVTIRDAEGNIDANKSYLICTEQGDGLYDSADVYDDFGNLIKKGGTSSWRVNFKWTFNQLMNVDTTGLKRSGGVYLPITIRALRADYVKHTYVDEGVTVSSPVTGQTYSNWRVLYSTLQVGQLNEDGEFVTMYTDVVYAGLGSDYGGRVQSVNLMNTFGKDFETYAKANLTEGETYYFSVDVMHADGTELNVYRDAISDKHPGEVTYESFVYSAKLFTGESTGDDTEIGGGDDDNLGA